MNILIVNRVEMYPTKGGVQRISYDLTKEFIKRGHGVFHLVLKKQYPDETYEMPCRMLCLNQEDSFDASAVDEIGAMLEAQKIDIVLIQGGWTPIIQCFETNFNVPIVVVLHHSPNYETQMLDNGAKRFLDLGYKELARNVVKQILKPYLKWEKTKQARCRYACVYQNSERLVLLSNQFKTSFLKLIQSKDVSKLCAIPNFVVSRLKEPIPEKEKVILFVGRLSDLDKRPDRLICIWEKIWQKYPDWHLRIAGDGPIKAELERYVAKKKIGNVSFLGFVSPEDEYKKAKVLCMTSTYEGFGLVLVEASVYGCVPIAFDSFASLTDIINHRKNGVIVPAFDLQQYQIELERLMTEDDYREMLMKQAMVTYRKFDKDQIVEQWLNLFEDVLVQYKIDELSSLENVREER